MRSRLGMLLPSLLAVAVVTTAPGLATTHRDPSAVGAWSSPFEEPGPACTTDSKGLQHCKPAGASVVVLTNGDILYWNALEGTENVQHNTVLEFGQQAVNDQVRLMTLGAHPTWTKTTPDDGGATSTPDCLLPAPLCGSNPAGSGSLFCSDQVQLANGDILDTGGTSYYNDPQIPGTPYGVAELQGLTSTRIYHEDTNTWTQTGSMHYGRWYPSLITLPNGQIFVAGGVTKLLKPLYPSSLTDSGTNVKQTETYDPATGTWSYNGTNADKSFPLFPRLHLLPDGKIFYDGAGQTYNPQGQSYDEALWNIDSVYDPKSQSWTNLTVPGIGTASPGFRGSAFSQMLTLSPPYTSASFLSAGGVLGVTPGTYVATSTSEINTVDTSNGDALTTTATANLNNARWYGSAVTLPDGTVLTFSGATADEVVAPGSGMPVTMAELFNPTTKTWTQLSTASHGRTYHNSAVLLPDGRVLVGGHSPIPTGYGNVDTLPGGFSNNSRDPSFEIFSPPYLFRGARPVIEDAPGFAAYGKHISIETKDAAGINKVVLVRFPAVTHLVDGDQRVVELPITGRDGDSITAAMPSNAAVLPPGPYMLFVLKSSSAGEIPSTAATVFVGTTHGENGTGR